MHLVASNLSIQFESLQSSENQALLVESIEIFSLLLVLLPIEELLFPCTEQCPFLPLSLPLSNNIVEKLLLNLLLLNDVLLYVLPLQIFLVQLLTGQLLFALHIIDPLL